MAKGCLMLGGVLWPGLQLSACRKMHCCSRQWGNLTLLTFPFSSWQQLSVFLVFSVSPLTLYLHVFLHSSFFFHQIKFGASAFSMCASPHNLCILRSSVKTQISQLWALFEAYYTYDTLFSHPFNHSDISFHAPLFHSLNPVFFCLRGVLATPLWNNGFR